MDLDTILLEMNKLANNKDAETAHHSADKLLITLIQRLAESQADLQPQVAKIVQSWTAVKKWYS